MNALDDVPDDVPDDNPEVTIRREGNTWIINITGSITGSSDAKITGAFMKAMEASPQQVVLDFQHATYINSAGIAILIRIVVNWSRNGHKLTMCGLNEHFQKIFRMVGFTQYTEFG